MQDNIKKSALIIYRCPFESHRIKEANDAILTACAFINNTIIVFMDDGVLHLSAANNITKTETLELLSYFNSKKIYVEQTSLADHDLNQNELITKANSICSQDIGEMLKQNDIILSF